MGAAKGSIPWNADKGNGWTDKRGYRWRYVEENGRRRARREHRVIMEAHLGRRLEPWEVVHHKDGNPINNDPSNLEVVEFGAHTAEHHTGARHAERAKKTIEAFGLLREELKHVRRVNADLLAAARRFMTQFVVDGDPLSLAIPDDMDADNFVERYAELETAIRKATGG